MLSWRTRFDNVDCLFRLDFVEYLKGLHICKKVKFSMVISLKMKKMVLDIKCEEAKMVLI